LYENFFSHSFFSRFWAERRQRREIAATKANEAKSKIRTNYLKMLAIQQLKGEQSEYASLKMRDMHD
jgi:hypothetical protein